MKNTIIASTIIISSFLLTGQAEARGEIGLGVVGEDPTGLTLKLKLSEQQALDFRLGLGFRSENAFLGQVNYLLSPFTIAKNESFDLPFYVGIGGSLFVFNNNNDINDENIGISARLPVGAALELNVVPLDIFLEIAPQVSLLPELALGVDGALGVRYWF